MTINDLFSTFTFKVKKRRENEKQDLTIRGTIQNKTANTDKGRQGQNERFGEVADQNKPG